MLARSYLVLGRFAEALPAYQRAAALQPQNASLLADYADTIAATKRTTNEPGTDRSIDRPWRSIRASEGPRAGRHRRVRPRRLHRCVGRWQKMLSPRAARQRHRPPGRCEHRSKRAPSSVPRGERRPAPATTPAADPDGARSGRVSGTVTLDPGARSAGRRPATPSSSSPVPPKAHACRWRSARARRRPAAALHARRQPGDVARHDGLEREAAHRCGASARAGTRRRAGRPHRRVGARGARRQRPSVRIDRVVATP